LNILEKTNTEYNILYLYILITNKIIFQTKIYSFFIDVGNEKNKFRLPDTRKKLFEVKAMIA
jgi:hypothetical protein